MGNRMAPSPQPLPDDLIPDILLRLPPDDPVGLVRSSAVCKAWRRIITDPAFLGNYRALHPTAPVLGFLHRPREAKLPRFVSTTSFRPAAADHRQRPLDCRHGRAVFYDYGSPAFHGSYVVWDPATGELHKVHATLGGDDFLPHPAVLCAAGRGCDHRGCSGGPFIVAFVGLQDLYLPDFGDDDDDETTDEDEDEDDDLLNMNDNEDDDDETTDEDEDEDEDDDLLNMNDNEDLLNMNDDEDEDEDDDDEGGFIDAHACFYASDTGEVAGQIHVHLGQGRYDLDHDRPAALVGDSLYFLCTPRGILRYRYGLLRRLGTMDILSAGFREEDVLSMMELPSWERFGIGKNADVVVMEAEGGGLGLACLSPKTGTKLYLLAREAEGPVGDDAAGSGQWVQRRVIDLKMLLPVGNPKRKPYFRGVAQDANVIFVSTEDGVFSIDLGRSSLQTRKVCEVGVVDDWMYPFVSFYTESLLLKLASGKLPAPVGNQ